MKRTIDLAYKVSLVSIVANIFLCIFKFLAGILGKSTIMISDAIHSASDVVSTIIVIIGIFLSRKESDKNHPYGHEKIECLAAIILVFLLFTLGFSLMETSIKDIINGNYKNIAIPTILPFIAALVSIVIKEWMYIYTKKAGKKLNSDALIADAWHHRSDALSSGGALLGIVGVYFGIKILDPIVIIIISIFIIKASWDILKDAINKLIDTSADDKTIEKIMKLTKEDTNIKNIDSLKTRQFGSKIYVDLEIAVPEELSLIEAHDIAEKIHLKIEDNILNCKHCMVHVNPYSEEDLK